MPADDVAESGPLVESAAVDVDAVGCGSPLLPLAPESGAVLNLLLAEEVDAELRSSRLGAVGVVGWGLLSTVDVIVCG